MAKLDIMKSLDKTLFQKLEELKNHREVQKALDAYASLDEKPQDLVKIIMAASLVLIPLMTISIFYGMNASLQSELETKKDLLNMSQDIIAKRSAVDQAKGALLGSTPVRTMNEMQNLISRAAAMANIDSSKISVSNFDRVEQEGLISQSIIDLKFTGLSNDEMFGLFSALTQRQKVKLEQVSARKNEANNLLEGTATVHYISQDAQGQF